MFQPSPGKDICIWAVSSFRLLPCRLQWTLLCGHKLHSAGLSVQEHNCRGTQCAWIFKVWRGRSPCSCLQRGVGIQFVYTLKAPGSPLPSLKRSWCDLIQDTLVLGWSADITSSAGTSLSLPIMERKHIPVHHGWTSGFFAAEIRFASIPQGGIFGQVYYL